MLFLHEPARTLYRRPARRYSSRHPGGSGPCVPRAGHPGITPSEPEAQLTGRRAIASSGPEAQVNSRARFCDSLASEAVPAQPAHARRCPWPAEAIDARPGGAPNIATSGAAAGGGTPGPRRPFDSRPGGATEAADPNTPENRPDAAALRDMLRREFGRHASTAGAHSAPRGAATVKGGSWKPAAKATGDARRSAASSEWTSAVDVASTTRPNPARNSAGRAWRRKSRRHGHRSRREKAHREAKMSSDQRRRADERYPRYPAERAPRRPAARRNRLSGP